MGDVPTYSYYRGVLGDLAMPLAFVDLDLFDRNAAEVVDRSAGKPVRVASKSVRCVGLLQRLLSRQGFRGVLCFTAPEALHLSKHGVDDLVVAYPTWEPSHIRDVARSSSEGRPITLMVDSPAHVAHVERYAREVEANVPLCVDVDLSMDLPGMRFGVWRSPLRTTADVLAVGAAIGRAPHVFLDGVMGYEAQVAGLPDRAPGRKGRSTVIRSLKKRSEKVANARRSEIVAALSNAGHELRFVNGGGTGSIDSTAADASVTEVTVGSAFFAPALFDHYDAFKYLPAAAYALRIVRRPAPDVFTCLGGGYVASGATGPDKAPVPYLPKGAELLSTEGAGEVQTPVRYRGSEELEIGSPIFMRHAKAGELCERFEVLKLVLDGRVASEVPTYRGEGRGFL